MPAPPTRLRSIVYVDGFNLYYGALKDGPYKWLNLEKYFRLLRPDDDLRAIYFCTARVTGPKKPNQDAYFRALATEPLIKVVEGKFKLKEVRCLVPACTYTGDKVVKSQQEKRTDVNIALLMLDDAYRDQCDQFVIVSGDSDLVPAVEMVKARFPNKKVVVYVPARSAIRGAATELRSVADKNRTLPLLPLLRLAQFPPTFPDALGNPIQKPASW